MPTLSRDTLRLVSGTVDLARRRFLTGTDEIRLTTTEAALLRYLADAAGRPVPREEILREVWGYAPDSLSRTVDVTMRRLRAKVEPDPAFPTHLLSVHGVGYTFVPAPPEGTAAPSVAEPAERVERAEADEGAEDAEPRVPEEASAGGTEPVVGGAPASTEAFEALGEAARSRAAADEAIGRADARAAAWKLLREGARPLTLVGPAGVGKTRLARLLFEEARAAGKQCRFVDLSAATNAEDLALAAAAALRLEAPTDRALTAALARAGDAFVVLDNFEQLDAEATERVGRWLAAAPGIAVVITSRRRLGLLEEIVLPIEPLGVEDAVALFRRRARRVRADVQLEDEALLRSIVTRLDGLPLAIELAAARVRALSLGELANRLELRFLRDPAPTHRWATLRAALDASWALLPAEPRRALAALSAVPGTTSVAVAEELLARVGVDDPLDAIETLTEHSLLRIEEGPSGARAARIALFVCVTEYAGARIAEAGAEGAAAAWIGALADTMERWAATLQGADGRHAMTRILAEADGVVAAVQRAQTLAATARAEGEDAMADAVRAAWNFHRAAELQGGHPAEVYVLDRAVAFTRESGDVPTLARLLSSRVRAHDRAGRLAEACADADEVARLAAEHPGLRDENARAQFARVTALRHAEHPEAALAALAGLEVPPTASAGFRSYAASERGLLLNRLGDPGAAAAAFEEAFRIAAQGGEGRRAEMAFDHLALARVDEGTAGSMETQVRAERDRRRAAGGDAQASPLNYVLGAIALEAGRLEEAREGFLAEQRSAETRGRVTAVAAGFVNLGLVTLHAGEPAQAVQEFGEALRRYRAARPDGIPLIAPVGLAVARVAAGERGVVLGVDPTRVPGTPVDRAMAALGEAVVAFGAVPPEERESARARVLAAAAHPATGLSDDLRALARFARRWFADR